MKGINLNTQDRKEFKHYTSKEIRTWGDFFQFIDGKHCERRLKGYLLCQHVTRTETAPGSFLLLVLKKSMVQDAKTSRRIEKSLDAIFKDTIVHAGRVDQIGTLLPKYPMIISLFGFLYIEI